MYSEPCNNRSDAVATTKKTLDLLANLLEIYTFAFLRTNLLLPLLFLFLFLFPQHSLVHFLLRNPTTFEKKAFL